MEPGNSDALLDSNTFPPKENDPTETEDFTLVETSDQMDTELPPKFTLSKDSPPPNLMAHFSCQSFITRGCQFSPDGLCLLTNSEDNKLRIFETPQQTGQDAPIELKPCLVMSEGELIYDFCWYPTMDSRHPDTCCFVSTAQYAPIHLYDAYDGHIRATYR